MSDATHTKTDRDHYRSLGAVLGERYYSRAGDLQNAESGGHGKVNKRALAKLRRNIAKAAKAFDAAHAALEAAGKAWDDR